VLFFYVKLLVELPSARGSNGAVEFSEFTGSASNFDKLFCPAEFYPDSEEPPFLTDSSSDSDFLSFDSDFSEDLPLFLAMTSYFFFVTISMKVSFFVPDVMVALGRRVKKFCWKLLISQPFFGRKTGRFKFQIFGSACHLN
jgi:hypothetical protein